MSNSSYYSCAIIYSYATFHATNFRPPIFLLSTFTTSSSPYLQASPEVGVDVSNIVTNSSVDTSVTSLSTTLTPGNSTLQNTSGSIDDWSTRVTRAGILATCSISCTPHVGGNSGCTVLSLAGSTGDDWNRDLSQS